MTEPTTQPVAAVVAELLTKRYGSLTAIEDLSFTVAPGEIVGFLGPNGAGKSTTMKILAGTMAGTSGRATIWGESVSLNPAAAKSHLAYMPENNPLPDDLRVEEYLTLRAKLKNVANNDVQARVEKVMIDCDLIRRAKGRLIGQLSKGFRQRVGIADAYADPGDLVILISSSGQSRNLINGALQARKMGLKVVTLSGFDEKNPLRKLGDIELWVNNSNYNIVEMTHHIWLVAIVDYIIAFKNGALK
jgi:ABC-type branched-subunit amino acid transport system ATPase component